MVVVVVAMTLTEAGTDVAPDSHRCNLPSMLAMFLRLQSAAAADRVQVAAEQQAAMLELALFYKTILTPLPTLLAHQYFHSLIQLIVPS